MKNLPDSLVMWLKKYRMDLAYIIVWCLLYSALKASFDLLAFLLSNFYEKGIGQLIMVFQKWGMGMAKIWFYDNHKEGGTPKYDSITMGGLQTRFLWYNISMIPYTKGDTNCAQVHSIFTLGGCILFFNLVLDFKVKGVLSKVSTS